MEVRGREDWKENVMQINKHHNQQHARRALEGLGCKEVCVWLVIWKRKPLFWGVVKQGRKNKIIYSWLLLYCLKACSCLFPLVYVLWAPTKLEFPGSKAEFVRI